MAEYVASPSCVKLHMQRSYVEQRGCIAWNSHFRIAQSCKKYSHGGCKVVQRSVWKMWELNHSLLNLKLSPRLRETSLKSTCLGSLVNPDGATASDWIPIVDQVLLMTSMFLTYTAGVIPARKSYVNCPNNIYNDDVVSESSNTSGSDMKNDDRVDSKNALDVVKRKLLDSVNALEHGRKLGARILEFEDHHAKQPLSLNAVAEGPRLHLLWASFRQVEEEVNKISQISEMANMDNCLAIFPEIMQKCCQPICMTWLEKELHLKESDTNKALASLILERLKGDDTVLQNIKKSGKEDLYAEFLCFLSFGSLREGCCYDNSLFILHGISILEDLVITLADGIASIFLELISVDGNLSNEMNRLGLALCTLSTRALQKLRNEVALNQWLFQNVEAIVSMYEDRFDLCNLKSQIVEVPRNSQTQNYSWWKRLTLQKSETVSSQMHQILISQFSMSVKRTKELRGLKGWRYYFSLLLELSDISMPLIRAVIDKVSNAISFFLVCLIGRSLGLIYTGIRQSLRWK
ncbi:uncharacterized protein LOC133858051 isoform X2 [Alnus glutinosa]|uniref:uncharacterized protein LOC133858051 isoform X2 n=1 Tax=Alnus glutinosa TaxID=3517 RepID=UPI002D7A2808|nr:uncharacterized protein LOC133858051 isoform X2 [Alnus glutinosa]XP_062149458.1 uncharacterized protein LOC133858051 isoform X2 [Alnus glutinosa]